ncbi:hypothetical protein UTI89UKE3_044 [Escherichia phage vB_EcoP-UTI89UKE3]|uniref:Uncharacterized protein n=1 Tax=Escherichia phage vB_EcoP-UTI89UKE2 TaxID=2865826 RepID=A0AAE7XUS3_9CAUD|nr:hypothetical protein UTI89UKE2_044 [Escherichia phage vB_EcoP-UTI89UKE2]QZI84645.1 hypothetical protein UTI89UKE3_044 [Escherichia phage vB_EcoP-UTI89UKE3]
MANDYSSQPLTGKSKRKQVQPVSEALMLPVISKEEASKKSNVINDATKSGKQKGAMVCLEVDGALKIAIAVDGKEDSEWKLVTGEPTITPV